MSIFFNRSPILDTSVPYMQQALANAHVSGNGPFSEKCTKWMEERFGAERAMLTTSCSHALEMAAHLCNIGPGDEVIMPSYTFSSAANAVVGRGGVPVFVDIRPDTMNLDETLVEAAITPRTKAILVMHYAGVACEMDTILEIAARHALLVVEDAAQGVMAAYRGKALGTLSDIGCFSFHETKNYSMGEGGALLLGRPQDIGRAEIIWEKGTNRSKFFRGQVDKYSWVDWGSSYLPSELNAAYLWSQLERAGTINEDRLASWNLYRELLSGLAAAGRIELPVIPAHCAHNAHMFFIKVKDIEERTRLLRYLKDNGIGAVYHYVPLHSAPAGQKFGRFCGEDRHTTRDSGRLLRLPLYYGIGADAVEASAKAIAAFFS